MLIMYVFEADLRFKMFLLVCFMHGIAACVQTCTSLCIHRSTGVMFPVIVPMASWFTM